MTFRKCKSCGAKEAVPLSHWSNFRLYRWWKGGKWAKLDNIWHQTKEGDYLNYPGVGVHYTYNGITDREDYCSK